MLIHRLFGSLPGAEPAPSVPVPDRGVASVAVDISLVLTKLRTMITAISSNTHTNTRLSGVSKRPLQAPASNQHLSSSRPPGAHPPPQRRATRPTVRRTVVPSVPSLPAPTPHPPPLSLPCGPGDPATFFSGAPPAFPWFCTATVGRAGAAGVFHWSGWRMRGRPRGVMPAPRSCCF